MKKLLVGLVAAACTLAFAPAPASHAQTTATSCAASVDIAAAIQASTFSPEDKATLLGLADAVPTPAAEIAAIVANDYTAMRDEAIAEDATCSSTALDAWFDATLDDDIMMTLLVLSFFGLLDVPTYDALVYGVEAKGNTFGYNGEYTNVINHTMRDLRRFWDIDGARISVMPMHGAAVYQDLPRAARALEVMGWSPDEALALATVTQEMINEYPALQGGDHPIFTFNAFAFSGADSDDPFVRSISDRIVMGDGILAGMAGIGLGRTAPAAILAHEYAHHVQYQKNLFESDLEGPEATRRTELMADAFASYFLVHKKGESYNKHLVLSEAKNFYEVGDCSFTSDGHHGTPDQRYAASLWGVSLAGEAANSSSILPSLTLAAKFEAKLPQLVA